MSAHYALDPATASRGRTEVTIHLKAAPIDQSAVRVSAPTAAEIQAIWPSRLKANGQGGVGRFGCVVQTDGRLSACRPYFETPRGLGLSEAAMSLFGRFSYEPAMRDGEPVASFAHIGLVFGRDSSVTSGGTFGVSRSSCNLANNLSCPANPNSVSLWLESHGLSFSSNNQASGAPGRNGSRWMFVAGYQDSVLMSWPQVEGAVRGRIDVHMWREYYSPIQRAGRQVLSEEILWQINCNTTEVRTLRVDTYPERGRYGVRDRVERNGDWWTPTPFDLEYEVGRSACTAARAASADAFNAVMPDNQRRQFEILSAPRASRVAP